MASHANPCTELNEYLSLISVLHLLLLLWNESGFFPRECIFRQGSSKLKKSIVGNL